jgi:hypothetical protein
MLITQIKSFVVVICVDVTKNVCEQQYFETLACKSGDEAYKMIQCILLAYIWQ